MFLAKSKPGPLGLKEAVATQKVSKVLLAFGKLGLFSTLANSVLYKPRIRPTKSFLYMDRSVSFMLRHHDL